MRLNTILAGIAMTLLLLALPASASDYTLEIFGNANEDDTINMQDVTYTELIILEYRDETELADAKHDGKINMQDVTQIELVILGKEKEMTVIDATDRIVTIQKPIERIVCTGMQHIRTIAALGAADKIVGVPDTIYGKDTPCFFFLIAYPELTELPDVGSPYSPSIEMIASLEPDLVLAPRSTTADTIRETTGIPTMCIDTSEALDFKWFKFMGYVLNEQERSEELTSYLNEKIDEVTEVTSNIPDDEKPEAYLAFWTFLETITYTPAVYAPVELAGGINVAEEGVPGPFGPGMLQVSKEHIIAWNPETILIHSCSVPYIGVPIEDVLSDPDLQSVSAVKNEDVYYTKGYQWGWDPATGVCEVFYMARLFHPEEFADMDVEEKGNEILEEVYGADGLWTEITALFDLYTWE